MGPLNDAMKEELVEQQGTSSTRSTGRRSASISSMLEKTRRLAERRLVRRRDDGARCTSSASEDRRPTPEELAAMQDARAPGDGGRRARRRLVADLRARHYAKTDELIALARGRRAAAAACTSRTCAAKAIACSKRVDETDRHRARGRARRPRSTTSRPAGKANWPKMDDGDRARSRPRAREGLRITADMYTYTAGATGSTRRCRPGCRRAGSTPGSRACRIPAIRDARDGRDAQPTNTDWENLMRAPAGAENVLCRAAFKTERSSR